MILLVDGYNVINRVPELRSSLAGGLENARNKLALRVSAWSRTHPGTECVIVFDGAAQFAGGREQLLSGVRCLFSRTKHGGDDEIIRFVREYHGKPSDITVVSDDNKVGNNCRALGATVRPSNFIMDLKTRPSADRRRAPGDGKSIDSKTAAAIDKELRKKFGL